MKRMILNRKRIQGFTLLEFFIALTIGLIILAGVLQIYLISKRSSNLENAFAQVQENGRFIQAYVQRIIRLSGYRSPPTQPTVFTPMTDVFTAGSQYITGTTGTGTNGSDTLIIRYEGSGNGAGTPDGNIRDCLDRSADQGTIVTNTFSINANFEFQCQAVNANAAPSNSTQVLIGGVENFKVLYGEDLDGDRNADRYVPSNYAFLNMNNVVSIRISLLLRSDQAVTPYPQQSTYYLAGTSYTPAVADQIFRRQVTFTVLLRNLKSAPV